MFCPECKAEYEPHVRKCRDCQVPLVESLPDEPGPAYQEIVTIYSAPSILLLDMAQSILRAAGIEYFVKGELIQNIIGLGSYGGSFNLSVGPPEIQVAPEDVEDAKTLLKDLDESEYSDEESEENRDSEESLTEEDERIADEESDTHKF